MSQNQNEEVVRKINIIKINHIKIYRNQNI